MKKAFDPSLLQRGDCALYRPQDIFGAIIAVKTWTKVCHVEVFAGFGYSYASRNGIGVGTYPLRKDGVAAILRPTQPLNWQKAEDWFLSTAKGQKYDWKGLLCFALAVKQGSKNRMFCSEFSTRFYRKAGLPLFPLWWDADRTPPSLMLATNGLNLIWDDGELW